MGLQALALISHSAALATPASWYTSLFLLKGFNDAEKTLGFNGQDRIGKSGHGFLVWFVVMALCWEVDDASVKPLKQRRELNPHFLPPEGSNY